MKNFQRYLEEHESSITEAVAIEEASRCLLCHDAPCNKGCPAGVNPSKFIRSIRFGNFYGAAKTIREANVFGGVCGRVCPFGELCEKECSRSGIDRPIEIGRLQSFAIEYEKKNNLKFFKKTSVGNKAKVAVIGAGPAGLACAAQLAQLDYKVTVFDKASAAGGILTYGITPSRLPQDVVDYEIQHIKNLGVEFVLDCEIGKDISIDKLKLKGYKAFLLAIGNQRAKHLNIPGSNMKGIIQAIEFLKLAKATKGFNAPMGKQVIVLGGGDVAMDAAITARLLGAEKVIILYRRRLEDMPATKKEMEYARSLDIDIYTTFTPIEYIGLAGAITAIKATSKYSNSEAILETDMVVEAIGQENDDIQRVLSVVCNEDGEVIVEDEFGTTNIRGVFAAGDVVNGGSTVVKAVQEGKKAADGIDKYLMILSNKPNLNVITNKEPNLLETEFCGVRCDNPFFLASSPVSGNYEMCKKALEAGWGGVVYKTVGKFIANECSPRFDNLKKESMSFVGFKNMEQISDKPLEKNLEMMAKLKKEFPNKVLIASIMGANDDEWTSLAKLVTEIGADIIECNFSCPQMTTHEMGSDVGQNPELVKQYSKAVRKGTHLPIIAKMTPNIGNMEIPAIAAIEGGANALAAINTVKSITGIDLDKFVCLPSVNGKSSISGYSGKAIKPIALRFVAQLAQHSKLAGIPISGIGGIETWRDAAEFITVGAGNLQVTTAIMQYGYRVVEDMIEGLSYYMQQKGFKSIKDMLGISLKNIVSAEQLDRDFYIVPKIDTERCIGCGRCYISCFDAGHQAIDWDAEKRRPAINDKCVGCHLCLNVCPAENCITPSEVKFKKGTTPHNVII